MMNIFLAPIKHCLNAVANQAIMDDHVHLPTGIYFQQNSIQCHKSKIVRLVLGIQQWVFYVKVTAAIIRSQSYGALLGSGRKEDPNSGYAAKQSKRVIGYYNDIRDQHFKRGNIIKFIPRRINAVL